MTDGFVLFIAFLLIPPFACGFLLLALWGESNG